MARHKGLGMAHEKHRNSNKIIYEERVYQDVFPFVRLFQGFWLSACIFFSLMSLIPVFHWHSYRDLFAMIGPDQVRIWRFLVLYLPAYLAIALCIGVLLCRMSRWIGIVALMYCVPALAFSALIFIAVGFITAQSIVQGRDDPILWLLTCSMILFLVPFGYVCFLGFRAGRRLVFTGVETKSIVSEINTRSRVSSEWFFKMIGMPLPTKHMNKSKVSSTVLFMGSGIAFSCFASFASFTPGSFIIPLVVSILDATFVLDNMEMSGDSETDPLFDSMIQVMKFIPLIFSSLAILALILGRFMRAGARRLATTSMLESQGNDRRPPILFLRPFYDDQVALAPPELPLLGRLINFMQRKRTLDVLLLEEATAFGPVVALGNPTDPIPSYGAARGYFSHGDWRKGVEQLANDSLRIIICLDTTEGVLWELEHLVAQGHAEKTLCVLHPSAQDQTVNRKLRQTVISRIEATANTSFDLGKLAESDDSVLGFFFTGSGRALVGVSSEFSEASYLLMTRWFLRTVDDGRATENA